MPAHWDTLGAPTTISAKPSAKPSALFHFLLDSVRSMQDSFGSYKESRIQKKPIPHPIQSCENMYTEQARTVVLAIVCVASVTTSASRLEQPPCTKCLLVPSSAQQPCKTTSNRLIGHGGAETMLSHVYKTRILSSS